MTLKNDPLKIDLHEPPEAGFLLQPVIPVEAYHDLNGQGFADYLWPGIEGVQQAERKTWHELLSDLGAVEDQLRRELQAHPEVTTKLIIEGVALPVMDGTRVYHKVKKDFLVPAHTYHKSLDSVYAWLYQVEKYIEVYFTPDLECTVRLLARCYLADQREDHETFRRYIKTATWHPNPQVQRLLGVSGETKIGPVKAEALIRAKGTVWNVLSAQPGELTGVEGMGLKLSRDLLRGIGRPDV